MDFCVSETLKPAEAGAPKAIVSSRFELKLDYRRAEAGVVQGKYYLPYSKAGLMRAAAVLDKGPEEDAERGDQEPWLAFEHFDDSPTDKEGEQKKGQNGQRKFHQALL